MALNDREREIRKWQEKLEEAFSYQNVVGGRFLLPLIDQERAVGQHFVEKYRGHRVLIDSFFDFFGRTLQTAAHVVTRVGWPANRPYYHDCFLRFLALFRTARAAELLSTSGYPLEGYTLQRGLKEQLFALAGVANKLVTMPGLRGLDKAPAGEWTEEDRQKVRNAGIAIERKIRRSLLRDNLSADSIAALAKWDDLFNLQVHSSQLTQAVELNRLVGAKGTLSVGPVPNELLDAMYMNRSHEIGWMIVRILPFLQLNEAPFGEEWEADWHLLDSSFRFMIEGLGSLRKKIAPAFFEFIDLKFRFDPTLRYLEEGTPTVSA